MSVAAKARSALPSLAADLQARGLVQAVTSPALLPRLSSASTRPLTAYYGVDPTADCTHIGNLLPMSVSLRLLLHGHRVVTLVGGATGAIGDPSGRTTERTAQSAAALARNEAGITRSVTAFYDTALAYASRRGYDVAGARDRLEVVNNRDWTAGVSLIDFLGDVGRHARVSAMLHRDSVRARLESDAGISFTEFTYQLLQANDFAHLYATRGCRLQIGGSDQWGNIVAGLDLIRRKLGAAQADADEAFGLTIPLVTTATGEKFGKSAGNAVWMDPARTSVFDYYQFFVRTADADVARYLRFFTLLSTEEIDAVMADHAKRPEDRRAQHVLADEMTELVHSPNHLRRAQIQTALLFAKSRDALADAVGSNPDELVAAFEGDPRLVRVKWDDGMTVADLFARAGACASKSEAIKLAKRGGLYLNQDRVGDALTQTVRRDADLLAGGKLCILRTGKTNYWLIVPQ
ncbi:tyrosyl-tRNA synthetase [Blastocladiella emersonii ATCC 22665]|nr:tyrosyl-tRNA synthetase [Blastocladiella emersonii ATCC 22665]